MDESKKGFDVKGGLEGLLNGMLNVKELNLKLISSEFTTFNEKQALRYQVEDGDNRIDGIITMKERLAYHIILGQTISSYKETETDNFFGSFKFNSSTSQ